ncbi:MAG: HDOD domain-containing protein [Bryobacteraceae bacterium]
MTLALKQENCRDQILRSLSGLPPFSPTLNRVMASLANEDVSFSSLSDLIEKDTVLAGNILKVVNSALYGRRGAVNSVRHAVALLGVNKLRNTVLGMSITRMWARVKTPGGWSTKDFNMHSVAVAVLSDLLAQRTGVCYPEGAFIAGLLHDLGRLLIAIAAADEYNEIMALYAAHHRTLCDCEREVLGLDHAEVSSLALAAWNLPEPIQTAVRYHHQPDDDPTPSETGRTRLSRVVFAVDSYVNYLGNCVQPKSAELDEVSQQPFLQLAGNAAELVMRDFEVEYEAIRRFF